MSDRAERPRRRWPLLVLGAVLVPSIIGGGAAGWGIKFDLPDVRRLEDYSPPQSTRVLARDGTPLASFGEQRRIVVGYAAIPKTFERALVAVEDSNFYRHSGVDLQGILRAAWHDLRTLSLEQGASTITQQLARNLFLRPEKTLRRKFQELLLALEIEKTYSKQEILTLYANQVYMGHGRYGVEAASRFYFGVPAREMRLEQAALLAAIIQRPEGLSPFRNPERALRRRNHVLDRMVAEGFLKPAEARAAQREPLRLSPWVETADLAPYFNEEVRRFLQQRFGDDGVYKEGLEVRTTLDPRLQAAANRAVDAGLRELDKRQGWRGPASRLPPGEPAEAWESPAWRGGIVSGRIYDAVVTSVGPLAAEVRLGRRRGRLDSDAIAWTGRRYPPNLLRPGDVVRVRVVSLPTDSTAEVTLEQEPKVQGALIAIDPASGAVRSLVGGSDFSRSEFDRAVQAKRQCGSAFKPFVYAAALAAGKTASTTILDEPTVFLDPVTGAPYQPENYGEKYYGTLTLREALAKSANIATVKLLMDVGYEPVLDITRRLGISAELKPYPSLALGAFEVTLQEITSAYATFANNGVRVAPHLVTDVLAADGSTLQRARPEVRDAVPPQIAFLMNRLLEGVVTDGTGAAARELGRPLAGKTGTTDDFSDAWFIGYAPDLAVGVWVGFDEKRSLGRRETGAQAALPIWKAFMEAAYEGLPPQDFPVPPGVTFSTIDPATGLKASDAAGCKANLTESYLDGTEPTGYCSPAEHARLGLPYPFQRYPLDDDGRLTVPTQALEGLVHSEPGARLTGGATQLRFDGPEGAVSVALHRVPGDDPAPPVPEGTGPFLGKDGRRARIVVAPRP